MAASPHPWSVKGVSEEARAIAKAKAQENHMNIGTWLSNAIMMAALQEAKESHAYHQFGQVPKNPNEHSNGAIKGAANSPVSDDDATNALDNQRVSSKAEEAAGMTFQQLAKLVLQLATRLATVEQRQQQGIGNLQEQLKALQDSVASQADRPAANLDDEEHSFDELTAADDDISSVTSIDADPFLDQADSEQAMANQEQPNQTLAKTG